MTSQETLRLRIREVRRKWRLQTAAKGLSFLVVAAAVTALAGVWGADLYGFRPTAVWLVRVATGAAALLVSIRYLYLPLRRRVSDVQIARFIEERYPGLQDRLVTAVEFASSGPGATGLLDLQIRDALEKTSRVDLGVFLEQRKLALYGAAGGTALLLLFAFLNWGPDFVQYGLGRLYVPWVNADSGSAMSIEVSPQGVEIAKGGDVPLKAKLRGFDSREVRLFVRNEGNPAWAPLLMEPEPRGSGFGYLLVEVQTTLDYYVEAGGVHSPQYTLRVVEVPRVDRVDVTYNFPAYTRMEPQRVEDEGDLVAVRGTRAELRVRTSMKASKARLRFGDGGTLELQPGADREYAGSLVMNKSGTYVIELEAAGKSSVASREYEIDVTDDAPPTIQITKPMRDTRATSVEEVFSELRAEDDFGVRQLELRYSVNGGPEKSIPVFKGGQAQPAVSGSHTFFLEELGLQPGDLVSYFGRASDNNDVSGPGVSTSDIYFIEIRPFGQKYTQSQQAGGGGAGAGGGESQEALSRQQKEIIAATFKLIRDREKMDPKEYGDGLKSLALVQSRLQAQAQSVVDRMKRRGAGEADARFGKIAEFLAGAVTEMEKSALQLGSLNPSAAFPIEQKALQLLMRAESIFTDVQISFGNQGGGGGGSRANAEDLADLFELELNKLKNQYETVQRGEQAARDQKVDEALERLRELARRQQQQNERSRMGGQRAGSQSSSGGGGGGQQQIAQEAEALRRQLDRLSRERSSPELSRASSQLQKAIEEMKKSLGRSSSTGEATAGGLRAQQQLDEAQRALSRAKDAGLSQGLDQAAAESSQILEEQNRVQEALEQLSREKAKEDSPEVRQRREALTGRKAALADRVKNLGKSVEELGRQARKTQPESSARLGEAAGTIRDKKLPERILGGNPLIESGYYEIARSREEYVRSGLDEVNRQLEAARSGLGQTREGKLEDSLNRTRQLAEGLESLQRRLGGDPRGRQAQDGRGGGGRQAQQARQAAQQGQPGSQQGGQQPGGRAGGQQDGGQSGETGQGGRQSGQGQEARQAGNQQGGQSGSVPGGTTPGRDPQGMTANAFGPPIGVGRYSDEDSRQLRREAQQRLTDARELMRQLDRNATDQQNLDGVIDALRRLESARDFGSVEQVARLKAAIDLLRQVETDLGRDLATLTNKERYFYSDDSEAPQRYRKLVEEYYRSLARRR